MVATVTGSFVSEKYALINFKEDSFVGCAIAFPIEFLEDGTSNVLPPDIFKNLLLVGNTIRVHWSKKMNRFVVKF